MACPLAGPPLCAPQLAWVKVGSLSGCAQLATNALAHLSDSRACFFGLQLPAERAHAIACVCGLGHAGL